MYTSQLGELADERGLGGGRTSRQETSDCPSPGAGGKAQVGRDIQRGGGDAGGKRDVIKKASFCRREGGGLS